MGLTDKQELFVKEYIKDFNGTRAALAAGYSEKSARAQASENLTKPDIQAAIAKEIEARNKRVEVDQDYVLQRLIDIDQLDIIDILKDNGNVKPIHEWPKIWRQYLQGMDVADLFEGVGDEREQIGFLKKIKWPDKLKNLELLGRHVDVQAWRDRVENENIHTVILHDSQGTRVEGEEDGDA